MRITCLMVLLGAATVPASCGGPPAEDMNATSNEAGMASIAPNAVENAVRPPPAESAPRNVAEAGDAVCERVDAERAAGFAGLELTGTSGGYRFYGRPRELLCSEPGAGGRGECEVPGQAEIRVEGPDGVYGFRTSGESPAILTYSPEGVSCRAR